MILPIMAVMFGLALTWMMLTVGLPVTSTFLIVFLSTMFIPLVLIMVAFPFMGVTAMIPVGFVCAGAMIFGLTMMGTFPIGCAVLMFVTLACMFGIPFLSIPIGLQVSFFVVGSFVLATLMTIFV